MPRLITQAATVAARVAGGWSSSSGIEGAPRVAPLLRNGGVVATSAVERDLAGIDRVLSAQRAPRDSA
jgi:hypothetical protein